MKNEKLSHVDFVLVTRTKGLFFSPHRPEGFEFTPSSESKLRFVLRPIDPEKDACGNRLGLECKVYASFSATEEQTMFADSFNKNMSMLRVADTISLPHKYGEEILIDENGKYKEHYHPRRYLCPSDIVRLIELAESELSSKTDHFLRLLRWRQGIDASGEVIEHSSLYWRVGSGEYPLAPLKGGPSEKFVSHGMHGISWDDTDPKNLHELWAEKNIAEPLGHTLIREAAELSSESPRSAILIMTAALETAVKMHISKIAPYADWLMEEAPAPPIFKILRDYIPSIHLKQGNELVFWDKVKPFLKKVQELIEVRNKVAHTGKIPEDASSIDFYLGLVSDLLYLLDVLAGHEWAKTLTSYEFRKALGWPAPRHNRTIVTITSGY